MKTVAEIQEKQVELTCEVLGHINDLAFQVNEVAEITNDLMYATMHLWQGYLGVFVEPQEAKDES